jgi:predicted nucleic acid binding AN1-type Zn finger protein
MSATEITTKTAVKVNHTKPRCCMTSCRTKLKLTDTDCRCLQRFCNKHRLPEDHDCTVNYKAMRYLLASASTSTSTSTRKSGYTDLT